MIYPISVTSLRHVFKRSPFDLILSPPEESALVARAKEGDPVAMRRLFHASAGRIPAAAFTLENRAAQFGIEVDDLISEAVTEFPRAVRFFKAWNGVPFPAYVYAWTRGVCSDYIRQSGPIIEPPRLNSKAHPFTLQAYHNTFNTLSMDRLLEEQPRREWSWEGHQAAEVDPAITKAVGSALRLLPPRQRQMATLFYGFGGAEHTKAQTARALGVQPETIKTQIRAARKRLRAHLEDKIPLRRAAA